ncbi:MAG: hypothetical protein QXX95_00275 [Nitrososphaerales archaeon]
MVQKEDRRENRILLYKKLVDKISNIFNPRLKRRMKFIKEEAKTLGFSN